MYLRVPSDGDRLHKMYTNDVTLRSIDARSVRVEFVLFNGTTLKNKTSRLSFVTS